MAYRDREAASSKSTTSSADRSARSVFVGNISYEVGEEQLKQVFSQVGPVVHLRLVHDRETGKPKGYGFCEYNDPQTAESAIRNLNGYELNGRQLRVDSAAGGERSADEVQQLQAAFAAQQQELKAQESPYGAEVEPDKAPEAISRSVASLPPEQMFELMKQMKQCVHNNPNEAKSLLMSNPQLAYALLQAQVVMRIVDPQVAIAMLHRETPAVTQPFHQQTPPTFPADVPAAGVTPMYASPVPGMMPPPIVPPMPNAFPRGPPAPPPAHAVPHSGTEPELSADDQQQAQLLMQVLQLNESQIALLPPEDRRKVIELRNQLRSSV
ncbi:Cleavage stimulation factor subunit 2 [Toxocara canis]|uniref:Cleavage stimulation factor subunit 2 n=2 Tax=Toxocara canis TaxID=6265 RepID=A0A0B2UU04_TOXCA|nr:Cleavage stimulation factor subunit 2 [Toxocara canis]VDM40791.1 unnamed protein product [Toxocara canis]